MTSVAITSIHDLTFDALVGHGASNRVAASLATAVATAESKGNRICGLYYLESYCQQLESGRVDGDATPEVIRSRPGVVRVDAKGGFAQPAFDAGFSAAIEAARHSGVVGFSIEHSHTATALGYFTEQFACHGLVAIGMTNATARVAPPGGSTPVLGTNPIAMAVPTIDNQVAFQFDFSTSAVALGHITMAAADGREIPLGWAVDSNGEPTTDPHAALKGSLCSAGGYKGYGIGLMVEVLAAALTGSNLSMHVPALKARDGAPHNLGQFYLIIDPAAFEYDAFHHAIASLAEAVQADGDARLPGTSFSPAETVEVPDDLWNTLEGLTNNNAQ